MAMAKGEGMVLGERERGGRQTVIQDCNSYIKVLYLAWWQYRMAVPGVEYNYKYSCAGIPGLQYKYKYSRKGVPEV